MLPEPAACRLCGFDLVPADGAGVSTCRNCAGPAPARFADALDAFQRAAVDLRTAWEALDRPDAIARYGELPAFEDLVATVTGWTVGEEV